MTEDREGTEPDPRWTLANERTFLAWVRTTLAVVAGAVALDSLEIPDSAGLRLVVVSAMLVGAAVLAALAYRRWAAVDRAMRLRQPLPTFRLGLVITLTLAAASLGLAVVLAL